MALFDMWEGALWTSGLVACVGTQLAVSGASLGSGHGVVRVLVLRM